MHNSIPHLRYLYLHKSNTTVMNWSRREGSEQSAKKNPESRVCCNSQRTKALWSSSFSSCLPFLKSQTVWSVSAVYIYMHLPFVGRNKFKENGGPFTPTNINPINFIMGQFQKLPWYQAGISVYSKKFKTVQILFYGSPKFAFFASFMFGG